MFQVTGKYQIGDTVDFRYSSWTELLTGTITEIDRYIHDGKNVSLYIVKVYGTIHRVFESEIKNKV